MQPTTTDKLDVPTDVTPESRCSYCDHPFASERLCALHVGEEHRDEWTDADREAYEAAYEDESDDLFVYHLKVIAALVFVFFAFAYTYGFVLS